MTIDFHYTISCGLDGYLVELDAPPTAEQAKEIITEHCGKHNIDLSFAMKYTTWCVLFDTEFYKFHPDGFVFSWRHR